MKIISIIGSGTMGTGIAQLFASNDWGVNLIDNNSNALENSQSNLKKIINRMQEKGRLNSKGLKKILSNINWSTDITNIKDSSIVIEAVIEQLLVKQKIFLDIESHVSSDCIIATNTSSLSVAEIASNISYPHRIMGLHFFNPVPLMKLVELIPLKNTDSTLIKNIKNILGQFGKQVVTTQDSPGFIVNRIARPFYGEALKIYELEIANFATIDWAMKNYGKFKMGPFELMDYIGNDINYYATESVYIGSDYNPRFKPSKLQKHMVEKGFFGRKSGRGFYDYSLNSEIPKPDKDKNLGKQIFYRILSMLINEAADVLDNSIASRDDIDIAMTIGVNYPKGLLKWADEIGIIFIYDNLCKLKNKMEDNRYSPCPLIKKMAQENKTFYV
tara:strand:- start:298 stop:1458 length:1161 start_codon:yes stop_codon:yes gene_type:complete